MGFGQHEMFNKIYAEHFEARDTLAERVRALGRHAEGRFAEYIKRANVKESDGKLTDKEMIKELRDDQRRMTATLQIVVAVADEHDDVGTADMATSHIETHDKSAWMLSAHLRTR